jgi:pilus assembly protein Flp/PilA
MLELYTRLVLQVADLKDRLRSQRGQGMVEYGLILVLVSIAVIASLLLLSNQLKTVFNSIVGGLQGTS